MTTKSEAIAALKKEYPTLRSGDEKQGYTDLSPADYAATIEQWADTQLADEAKAREALKADAARTLALAKLAALGLTTDDLKALGL